MDRARFELVQKIFAEAIELPPSERAAYLERACEHEPSLRHDVETLISADAEAGSYIDRPMAPVGLHHSLVGTDLGPYHLVKALGQGGMGDVYEGERADGQYSKRVAVKLVRRGLESPGFLERFVRERQILARVEHPNVARLVDGGTSEHGVPYIVMEYIEGVRIDEYCDRHKLGIDDRIRLFRKVCSAIGSIHQNLIVHRDIKPGNVLVTAKGEPKILDFGIATLLRPDGSPPVTQVTGVSQRALTPDYASPEQVRGAPTTTLSDVYSLGVLLYELVAGRRPYRFAARSWDEIVRIVCEHDPPRPSDVVLPSDDEAVSGTGRGTDAKTIASARGLDPQKLRRRLAGDLDNIVLLALKKAPEERYPSVERLSEDLRRHQAGLPVTARPDTVTYLVSKFVKRHRAGVAASAAFVLTLSAITALAVRERGRAEREAAKATSVNEFLEDMLSSANPFEGTSRDVSVAETLDAARVGIDDAFADAPLVSASLKNTIGSTYRSLGRYEESRALLQEALSTRERVLGPEHLDVAESLNAYGMLLDDIGDLAEAERVLRRALEIRRKQLGEEHLEVADSLNNLVIVLRHAGKLEEARAHMTAALGMKRRLLGPEHRELAELLNNLALVESDAGNYDAAEERLREALTIARKRTNLHPFLPSIMANLASHLNERREYDEAEKLLRESLELKRELLGEEHPSTAFDYHNLGSTLLYKGEYQEAEPVLLRALELRRSILGEQHPDTMITSSNLAAMLAMQGDYERAEPLFRNAVEAQRSVLGEDHPDTALALHNHGVVLHRSGRAEEAEARLQEAIAVRRRVLGELHPNLAISLMALGEVLDARGKIERSRSALQEAVAILEQGSEATTLAEARNDFGRILAKLGRFPEAERQFLDALEFFKQSEQEEGEREAVTRLVNLYQSWDKPELAARYQQRLDR